MKCPFCEIASHGLPAHGLYEDAHAFVIMDRGSLGPDHCMVIPRAHVPTLYGLDESTYAPVMGLVRRLARLLQRISGRKAVGLTAFGSGLPHAHMHLVPH